MLDPFTRSRKRKNRLRQPVERTRKIGEGQTIKNRPFPALRTKPARLAVAPYPNAVLLSWFENGRDG